jgi:replicative DNA helicase
MPENELNLPPHSETVERAVLACALLSDVYLDLGEILRPEDFYFSRYRVIWDAMTRLSRAGEPIDCLTVANTLDAQQLEQVGGHAGIAELILDVSSASNAKSYAQQLRELSALRNLRRIGQHLVEGATAQEAAETLASDAEHGLFATLWARDTRRWRTASEVMVTALSEFDAAQARGGALPGITTGLADLDRLLGGWMLGDLVIVGARTSMGKTAFACTALLAAAKAGAHAAIMNLEMGERQLSARLLALESGVPVHSILGARTSQAQSGALKQAGMRLGNLPVHYYSAGSTLDQLRAKARQLRVKRQLDVLFVDYLQLLQLGRRTDNRQMEVAEMSRGLKLLAKDLEIAVIALSQVSRKCDERDDHRPVMSDLRESGAIEQDADIVMMLYRDEVYNEKSPDAGTAEILVRKHRNGPIGDVRVAFLKETARLADLQELS